MSIAVSTTEPVRVVATNAHEGLVYVLAENALYFTSLPEPGERPRVDIKRLAVESGEISVVRADAKVANGMALAPDGRLVVCEQDPAAVALVDPATGESETMVDSWRGLRLNSPNDVVVKRDGSVWFTDPSYGFLQGFRPPPEVGDFVYRYDPAGDRLTVVADSFDKPNGLALSSDEAVLYVGNWDPEHKVLMRYEIDGGGGRGEVLFDMTHAPGEDAIDGIKVDRDGNLFVCGPGGIWVLSPAGEQLGLLRLPEAPHNLAWGDEDGRTLYVTALTGVYRLRLAIPGLRP